MRWRIGAILLLIAIGRAACASQSGVFAETVVSGEHSGGFQIEPVE